jgi:hypothetical protein
MAASSKITITCVNGSFAFYDHSTTAVPRIAHTPDQLSSMVYQWALRQRR